MDTLTRRVQHSSRSEISRSWLWAPSIEYRLVGTPKTLRNVGRRDNSTKGLWVASKKCGKRKGVGSYPIRGSNCGLLNPKNSGRWTALMRTECRLVVSAFESRVELILHSGISLTLSLHIACEEVVFECRRNEEVVRLQISQHDSEIQQPTFGSLLHNSHRANDWQPSLKRFFTAGSLGHYKQICLQFFRKLNCIPLAFTEQKQFRTR